MIRIIEFEAENICRVASGNENLGKAVEDFLFQELQRNVKIKDDKLEIMVQGEADELDIITEILYDIFTFQYFKCIFLCPLFKLHEIAYTLAKMHHGYEDKLASICASRVASQYKDVDEILHENKYEFALKVCEAYKDLVKLNDKEIERVSGYLQVMTNGFSRVQPARKQTLANDFIIIETTDFVRTKKKELKPMKDFVIVKDDDNIRYEAIREAELCKRVNHEHRTVWF